MGTWLNIATGTTCLIVTIVGLLLSLLVWRKKGIRSGLRGIAWSLLPIAMYLTHAVRLVGNIVASIVRFGGAFVFSPKAWLGVILVGISALLFLISGGIPLLRWGRKRRAKSQGKIDASRDRGGHVTATPPPARQQQPGMPPSPGEDDMSDVQEILRRRGIK
jgi:hypothetical protein